MIRKIFVPFVAFVVAAGALGAWDRGHLPDYRARRAALVSQTGDGVIVLFGRTDADVASSVTPFHQNETFYYLTGWHEPDAMLMIVPKPGTAGEPAGIGREVLYIPARDPVRERWTGPKLTPDMPDAPAVAGVEAVRPAGLLPSELIEALKTYPKIYTPMTAQEESGEDAFVAANLARLKALAPLAKFEDARPLIETMRAVKSSGEIALIRRAAEITMAAHQAIMTALRPGQWEYELAALFRYETQRRGSEWVAYPPIVGSGFFSTVLHYDVNDRQMAGGDLVVIDAGASYSGYTSDLTRTLPVNGRFTPRQREIYDIVRGAQAAAIAAAKPGVQLRQGRGSLHEIALAYIDSHGRDREGRTLGRYFIHGLGHSVGLNVHDPIDVDRPLEPGMVVTIEPGIYIPEERIGVRIEDMLLITATGAEVMTRAVTSDPDEIERIMRR